MLVPPLARSASEGNGGTLPMKPQSELCHINFRMSRLFGLLLLFCLPILHVFGQRAETGAVSGVVTNAATLIRLEGATNKPHLLGNPSRPDPGRSSFLAVNYAGIALSNLARPRECVELLAKLLRVPSGLTVPMLKVDPTWDNVRDAPAFKALLMTFHPPLNLSRPDPGRSSFLAVGALSGTPGAGAIGLNSFVVMAADPTNYVDDATMNITVQNATVLTAPNRLTATAGNAQVALSWSASAGAKSYNVKRATVSGGPYATVGTPSGTSFTNNTGLTNGTTYYYVVSAVNGTGESANAGYENERDSHLVDFGK